MLQRLAGDAWGVSNSLAYLGLLASERGDQTRAAAAHQESLGPRWTARDWEDVAGSLADVAVVAAAVERSEAAARLFGAADAMLGEDERVRKLPERAVYERGELRARTALGADAFMAAFSAGSALPRERAIAEAVAFADEIAHPGARQSSGPLGDKVEEPPPG
ncbi:MAG: hypothetical protein H0V24_17850 [Chloroflexia bacterium]|nr:hypothetical protein [Chloroflexia bacterium]